jgi:uncharacterized protein YdhG (YjbR/CyaY superfamily)
LTVKSKGKLTVPADFEEYVRRFPERTQAALRSLRSTIQKSVPKADETISYGIPAFSLHGKVLVWFGGFKSHVGFYPGAAAVRAFANDLTGFKTSTGSVQFPLDRPLPFTLIDRIVKFRVGQAK